MQKPIYCPSAFPGHRRWLMPRGFFEDPDFSKVFPTLKDEVLKITDNDKKFEISVDTHGYKPEEMQVKVLDDVVTVEAKHEEKKSEENNKSFVSRQFSRYLVMYYIISRTTRIYLDRTQCVELKLRWWFYVHASTCPEIYF